MAEQPEGQRCETCLFWRSNSEAGLAPAYVDVLDDGSTAEVGLCRRYPGIPDNDACAIRPVTHSTRWCGEWAPANPETIEEGAAVMARLILLGDKTAAYALADKLKARDA